MISSVAYTEYCFSQAYSWIKLVTSPSCAADTCISDHPDDITVLLCYSTTSILTLANRYAYVPLVQYSLYAYRPLLYNTWSLV